MAFRVIRSNLKRVFQLTPGSRASGIDLQACLRLYIQGREKASFGSDGVRLDNIERNVLLPLGVPPIFLPVKICSIGFKDMLDAVPKAFDKGAAVSAKFHVLDFQLTANRGKFFQT